MEGMEFQEEKKEQFGNVMENTTNYINECMK